jgi:hypothetical protein
MATKLVDTSIICAWLGVPLDQWPPDHYTLLGLSPGEKDSGRIEQQVQQRLEQVRRYQLTNPEPATEAMNRLAQAFVCLSDPQAKQAYDLALYGSMNVPIPPAFESPTAEQPVAETAADAEFLSLVEEQRPAGEAPSPVLEEPAPPEPPPVPDHARRGLGTRRAVYERIVRTRALLRLWERAEKSIGQPRKRLARPSEARELIDVMMAIRDQLKDFPKLLGEAGQPGYLVVSLARQTAVVPTFQTLLPSQRDALARDWSAGKKALQEHQTFLRRESRELRRKTLIGQGLRAARGFLNDHPAGWLVMLGLLALGIALLRHQFLD